ncbi:MAG: InlB B-repeat-containing protein [Smithellaceae bacterium]
MGALRFIDELLIEMMGRDRAHFFGKSGDARPTEGLKVGDEYEEVDTGDRFIWYDERWHLKEAGTYSAIKFTLTFDKGDASSVEPATKEVTYDSTYGELATTTYVGYNLDGWFLDEGLTNEVSAEDTVLIEADTTVYPKHSPIDYDITYTLNGGTNGDNPTTYNIETPEITLDAPTKDGYVFDGWYGVADFSGDAVTKIALGSTGAKTLYAKWVADTFGITYELNGGTNAGANPATYTIETATITLADATKDGYTFAGWFSDAGLTTEVIEIVLGSFGDITLYAGWTAIDYDITYELNGGTNNEGNPDTYTIEDAVTFLAPTKDGYVFDGWYAEAGFTTLVTGWAAGTTGAKTLYAKWETV